MMRSVRAYTLKYPKWWQLRARRARRRIRRETERPLRKLYADDRAFHEHIRCEVERAAFDMADTGRPQNAPSEDLSDA